VNLTLFLLAFVALLLLGGIFAGTETGMYSASRLRVDAAAKSGGRTSRLVQHLLSDDARLLITLLFSYNLVLRCLASLTERQIAAWIAPPSGWSEALTSVVLTPLVFFWVDLLPKDLFHRRPLSMLHISAWPVVAMQRLLIPIALPLHGLALGIEWLLGVKPSVEREVFGQDAVVTLLDEGRRAGALSPRAEVLARNVLALRSIPLSRVMVPWSEVERVDRDLDGAALREAVSRSAYTRLPVVTAAGPIVGYLHQLEFLGDAESKGLPEHLRELSYLPPETTVDRALSRMRTFGQRIVVVGSAEAPLGIVTLKDLLERISGDLARW
jgi:CBS domain containing-hemolysin-like protein